MSLYWYAAVVTHQTEIMRRLTCNWNKHNVWGTFYVGRWPHQGWGLLSHFFPFRYFPNFSEWSKQWLPVKCQVYIWQVSPQLSCGDTWQIWTWLKVSDLYFCKIKISRNGEINERSFSNPHPWPPTGAPFTVRNELIEHWVLDVNKLLDKHTSVGCEYSSTSWFQQRFSPEQKLKYEKL